MGRRSSTTKLWLQRPGSKKNFVQLYHDMLDSPAFHDLSGSQAKLFLYCRREAFGRAQSDYESGNIEGLSFSGESSRLFYLNEALVKKQHKLYNANDKRGFRRDMEALVSHGFVDVVLNRAVSHKPNVYALSTRWTKWGTEEFSTPDSVKTTHMLNLERDAKRMSHGASEHQTLVTGSTKQESVLGDTMHQAEASCLGDEKHQEQAPQEKKRGASEHQALVTGSTKQGPKTPPLGDEKHQKTGKKGPSLGDEKHPYRISTPYVPESRESAVSLTDEDKRALTTLEDKLKVLNGLSESDAHTLVLNLANSGGVDFARERVQAMIASRKGAGGHAA